MPDGSLNTQVGGISTHFSEDALGLIVEVLLIRMGSIAKKTPTIEFVEDIGKIPELNYAGIKKNLLRRESTVF